MNCIRTGAAALRLLMGAIACWAGVSALSASDERFMGIERERIEEVIQLGYNLSEETEAKIAALRAEYPESPVPDLLESGRRYWYQNYAEWDEELTKEFKRFAEASLERAKDYADERDDDPEAQLVAALNEVVLLMHYVDEHKWWAAFWKARSSFRTLRRLLEENPELHDAKLPLGMAYCYSAQTPAYLKPLAFLLKFKGDLDKGLEYIRDANEGGLFLRVDAGYHLALIQKELVEDQVAAKRAFRTLVEEFPANAHFQIELARLERATGDDSSAVTRLQAVLELERIRRFPALWLHSLANLGWAALASEQFQLALETAQRAEQVATGHEQMPDALPWARMVRAEALNALGRPGEALEIYRSIPESHERLYRAAQERIGEIERSG